MSELTTNKSNSYLEQAAILLLCLGEEAAATVMQKLSREEVVRLSENMARLSGVKTSMARKVINNFFGQADIFLKIISRSISHDRIHAMIVCILYDLHAAAVIPVGDNRNGCFLCHGFHHPTEIFKGSISDKTGSKRNDNRCSQLLSCVHNAHEHLCIPYIEMRNCIMSCFCFFFPVSDIC